MVSVDGVVRVRVAGGAHQLSLGLIEHFPALLNLTFELLLHFLSLPTKRDPTPKRNDGTIFERKIRNSGRLQ